MRSRIARIFLISDPREEETRLAEERRALYVNIPDQAILTWLESLNFDSRTAQPEDQASTSRASNNNTIFDFPPSHGTSSSIRAHIDSLPDSDLTHAAKQLLCHTYGLYMSFFPLGRTGTASRPSSL